MIEEPSAVPAPSPPVAAGGRTDRWVALDLFAIPALMLSYAAFAFGLCAFFGRTSLFVSDHYLLPFWIFYLTGLGIVVSVYFALRGYRHMVGRAADRRIFGFDMPESARSLFRRIGIALPILLAMPVFMTGFTALKNLANVELPFAWDLPLHDFERWIHFGRLPWQWLDLQYWPATRFIEYVYACWGIVLVGVPFVVALSPIGPRRTRFFVTYILILVLLGNLCAALFMSAGPFYFEMTAAVPNDYAPLMAYLDHGERERLFSAPLFQTYLWAAYLQQQVEFGTGISAFPSVHVAMSMLWVIYFRKAALFLRIATVAHLVVVLFGSFHLAWHYAIDGYAGIIGTLGIWWVIRQIQRRGVVKRSAA